MSIELVALADIPFASVSYADRVSDYAERLKHVRDGRHRIAAARQIGATHIEAIIEPFSTSRTADPRESGDRRKNIKRQRSPNVRRQNEKPPASPSKRRSRSNLGIE